jgi:hypothetical protein
MPLRQKQMTFLSGGLAALAALATGGMATAPPDGPVRMSNLVIASITSEGIAGYSVIDSEGFRIGEITEVDSDRRGKARWLHVDLDAGGQAKLASFRGWLDARHQAVKLQLPEDIVVRHAEPDTVSSPSV